MEKQLDESLSSAFKVIQTENGPLAECQAQNCKYKAKKVKNKNCYQNLKKSHRNHYTSIAIAPQSQGWKSQSQI